MKTPRLVPAWLVGWPAALPAHLPRRRPKHTATNRPVALRRQGARVNHALAPLSPPSRRA